MTAVGILICFLSGLFLSVNLNPSKKSHIKLDWRGENLIKDNIVFKSMMAGTFFNGDQFNQRVYNLELNRSFSVNIKLM